MSNEPTFKLAVELTASQIEAMASLIESGADDLQEKIASESDYTAEDIAGANEQIKDANKGIEIIKQALADNCNEILAMFGLGYQNSQEAGQ
ncbi:hypothetical protein [Marinobacter salsuginis]|jgi:hypothetical protein|uniref:Uncharacterized protein n=1 Tax=Marinobacter salsuginis TaxID=418719 RepID=A0A5M3Q0H6_9GAMM|nr:hypothetical protein [Marinobacter salsuginis]GBO88725.1 hypothetical protein MSSD14B_23930 [Marinobacter salsuginis]